METSTVNTPLAASRSFVSEIETQVASWEGVTAHPHRFGATEFRLEQAEIGHIHREGVIVEVPFTLRVRDVLLADEQVQKHHWLPESGWTTFSVREQDEVAHAIWLLRLSYLRYGIKRGLPVNRTQNDVKAELSRITHDDALYFALTGENRSVPPTAHSAFC